MATRYADRCFISLNGTSLFDVQSGTLRQNLNARVVPSMTTDGYNRGFVKGNKDIDINFTIAIQNGLARPKLESIDYENNDVQATWLCGADQFIATGLFLKDVEDNSGGIGEESKAPFNFGALRLQDAVGNSSLFNITLNP